MSDAYNLKMPRAGPTLIRPIGKVPVVASVSPVSSRLQNHFHGFIMIVYSPILWIQSFEKCQAMDYSSYTHSKKMHLEYIVRKEFNDNLMFLVNSDSGI